MKVDFKIELCGGKYTYIRYKGGGQEALRYGEKWRELTGDGFVYSLAAAFEAAQKEGQEVHDYLCSVNPDNIHLSVLESCIQQRKIENQLRERLTALEADKARLDWAIQHPATFKDVAYKSLGGMEGEENQRVRLAIDSAMSAQKEGK